MPGTAAGAEVASQPTMPTTARAAPAIANNLVNVLEGFGGFGMTRTLPSGTVGIGEKLEQRGVDLGGPLLL